MHKMQGQQPPLLTYAKDMSTHMHVRIRMYLMISPNTASWYKQWLHSHMPNYISTYTRTYTHACNDIAHIATKSSSCLLRYQHTHTHTTGNLAHTKVLADTMVMRICQVDTHEHAHGHCRYSKAGARLPDITPDTSQVSGDDDESDDSSTHSLHKVRASISVIWYSGGPVTLLFVCMSAWLNRYPTCMWISCHYHDRGACNVSSGHSLRKLLGDMTMGYMSTYT